MLDPKAAGPNTGSKSPGSVCKARPKNLEQVATPNPRAQTTWA